MAVSSALRYPAMDQRDLDCFRAEVKGVAVHCRHAGLVGGAALRTHLDMAGLPVPKQGSGDLDLVVNDYGLPEAGVHRYGATVLDVFNTWTPFERPFFNIVDYRGVPLKLATPEHLLAKKLELSQGDQKDELHLSLLSSMVSSASVARYIRSLRANLPSYIELDEKAISLMAELTD